MKYSAPFSKSNFEQCRLTMKSALVLACVTVLVALGSDRATCVKKSAKINHGDSVSEVSFANFVARFNKPYASTPSEYHHRSAIFRNNLAKIERLNRREQNKPLSSAKYGVNLFADMSEAEFKRQKLGLKPLSAVDEEALSKGQMNFKKLWKQLLKEEGKSEPEILQALPESFDWRDHGAVSEVKDQGQCGSCWAFSTTGNIEGQLKINRNESVSLSEQELVDCDVVDAGCDGGLMTNAFDQVIKLGGLVSEKDYPYIAESANCTLKERQKKYTINGFVSLPPEDEDKMKIWLAKKGPLAVAINADSLRFYTKGTFHPNTVECPNKKDNLDHGVLLVGYGQELVKGQSLPYWLIKNSWAADWGEDGFFKLYRGDNTCGVSLWPSSAIVL